MRKSTTKICSKCQRVRPYDEFYKDKSRKDGLTLWCKSCCKASYYSNHQQRKNYKRNVYKKNREKILLYYKKRYKRIISGAPGTIRHEAKLAGFKSGFERTINANLKSRGVKFTYETLELPYVLQGTYHPDFILDNGVIVEAKGVLDRDSKRKMIAVKKQHPELDIRFCLMDAKKKVPGTKQTHAQWCERNGFLWCEGEIPEEWLNE